MSRHLVVFAKTPQPGRAKTRLSPPLSPGQAAAVARAFLLDALELGRELSDCELTLAYAPRGTRGEMKALAGPRWRLRVQRGRNLGERLSYAFASLLARPQDRAVIIGTDAPQLAPDRLAEAFTALDRSDLVLGPCEDGGYYLIGMRRWVRGLLDGVRWSTEFAFADTIGSANGHGLAWQVLATEHDVDEYRSLTRLARGLGGLPTTRAFHTRVELSRLGLHLGNP